MLMLRCGILRFYESASQRSVNSRDFFRRAILRKDHYDVLGVDRNSSMRQIKTAYIALSKKYHPDINPGNPELKARFLEIQEAYDALNSPQKRKLYDSASTRWSVEELRAQQYRDFVNNSGRFPYRQNEKPQEKNEIRWTWTIRNVKYSFNPFSNWSMLFLGVSTWMALSFVIYILLIIF